MKKGITLLIMLVVVLSGLLGCSNGRNNVVEVKFDHNASFDTIIEQAKGTKVRFYGWGGDEQRNKWLDTIVASALKEKYDITLERVPMDIDQILAKLSGEKQAEQDSGSIDMIWINGENFYSAKENGLLFGPFADKLPNFQKNIDINSEEIQKDFGYPIEGYEAPYSKAQMVLINDSAVTSETPKNTAELLAYAKKLKGKVTYPAPPDFTGSAFVRNVIYDIVGHKQFIDMEVDKDKVKAAIEPALAYLRELNPYLWNEGKTFPATSSKVENMFVDGELVMSMSYESYSVAVDIEKGIVPDTARTFIFDNGMIGNTNYIAIAANSPNKAAAMVAINEIISVELQASQFSALKSLPVVEYDKLTDDEKALFDKVHIGKGTIPQDELLSKRLPEMPAKLVPLIEEIWAEEVVGK
ncbi:ABC transporter substrate-binding protein [Serpentinicella alkaliphila]|nr:ABC transporter substrate-binding protein [Serpentinicella alkaliphila]QUH27173.1 ABC transporter substrate-binding protein [Serpentinicella alkaliphila]